VVGRESAGLGDRSPPVGSRQTPEVEEKCEISVQFLTFSSIKFRI